MLDFLLLVYRVILAVAVPPLTYYHMRNSFLEDSKAIATIAESLEISIIQSKNLYKAGAKKYIELGVKFSVIAKFKALFSYIKNSKTYVLNADKLVEELSASNPILIVTIYMGDFPVGFSKLMDFVENRRKIFAFKFNPQSKNEDMLFSLWRESGQDVFPLRAGEEGGKNAFMELRKGNIVALMVDAEVHVTSRVEVEFFGKKCFMQAGPATLATLTNSTIIPVINYEDENGRSIVQVESPLYSKKISNEESQKDKITRLTQGIASCMESWVRLNPSQVQRWSSMTEIMRCRNSENTY
jgi:lauroyl/myristoyl acyltransferase